jgi:excisionase family DNA binding protein
MNASEPQESFLTVAEVAEMLKLNQQTVRNWIDQGSFPALRMGRRVRIKRSDFERVLEQSYSAGTGSAARGVGPSAEDFWGGTPVGLAEPRPLEPAPDEPAPDEPTRDEHPPAEPAPDEPEPPRPGQAGATAPDGTTPRHPGNGQAPR